MGDVNGRGRLWRRWKKPQHKTMEGGSDCWTFIAAHSLFILHRQRGRGDLIKTGLSVGVGGAFLVPRSCCFATQIWKRWAENKDKVEGDAGGEREVGNWQHPPLFASCDFHAFGPPTLFFFFFRAAIPRGHPIIQSHIHPAWRSPQFLNCRRTWHVFDRIF